MIQPGQEPAKAVVRDTRVWFDAWLTAVEDRLGDLQRAIEETGGQP